MKVCPGLGNFRLPLAAALLGGAMLVIWGTALLSPLYPDEFAYRLIGSRYFFDHGLLGNVFVSCGSFTLPTPLTWIPAKIIDYLLFGWYDTPRSYRFVSLFILGVIAIGAGRGLRRAGRSGNSIMLFLCVISLGTLPFELALTRPEAAIFACLAWLIALALDKTPVWGKGIPTALLSLLLCSLLLSQHAETFILLPALIVIQIMILRRPGMPRGVGALAGAAALWLVVESAIYWAAFARCPENANIQYMLNSLTLSPHDLIANPAKFFADFSYNLLNSGRYVRDVWYRHHFANGWLPDRPYPQLVYVDMIANAIIDAILLAVFAGLGFLLFQASEAAERLFRRTWSAPLKPQTILSFLLAIAAFAWAGLNTGKQFYEISFLLPLLLFALFLHPRTARLIDGIVSARQAPWGLAGFMLLISVLDTEHFLMPFLNGFQGRSVSVLTLSPERVRRDIEIISPACGLGSDPATLSHIAIDDLTYQFMRKSFKPVMITWMQIATVDMDRAALLRSFGIGGVVARCGMVPEELKHGAYFHKPVESPDPMLDVCCVSPQVYDAR